MELIKYMVVKYEYQGKAFTNLIMDVHLIDGKPGLHVYLWHSEMNKMIRLEENVFYDPSIIFKELIYAKN